MYSQNFIRFLKYYGKGKYTQLFVFFILSCIAGLMEFVGIALIYPFVIMIIQPENIINSAAYIKFTDYTHIHNATVSALLIGFAALLIFIFKNLFIIFSQYFQNKFIANWKKDMSLKFMEYYLYAPYIDTMKSTQSNKIFVIGTLCAQAIDGFIMRGMNLLTNIIIIFMVISLLLIKFPVAAIITILFVSLSILIQNKYFKKRTSAIAETAESEYRKYNSALIENINNLKELKILSSEKVFFNNFKERESSYRNVQVLQGFYGSIPPYIVEILIVSALLILGMTISVQNITDNSAIIASFAIIVAALFRIAPALNRIQTSIININASRNFVKQINSEYEKCNLENFITYDSEITEKVDFNNKIELKNIKFSYNDDKQVIKNLSLEIEKGDFIGIIGLSGSGKSTLADIIMGLLIPQSGEIFVDNLKLTPKNFYKFRHIIGYVPQQINVLDKSFKENVAWGIPSEKTDEEGVIKALKASKLYDFVCEFKDGINAKPLIGSNGLSQGQKQRLAIARALYRDPEILIFDEATSSLDVQVESEITDMLTTLNNSKTIIAIAHRLSTLKTCNKLVYIKDGKIVDIGSFEELSQRHTDFCNLVKLSSIK